MTKQRTLYAAALVYTLSVYGSMAVMSIGAGIVFVAWIATRFGHLREDLRKFKSSPLFWPSIVFGVACVWSLVWAKATDLSFMGLKPQIDWLTDTRKLWHLYFPFVFAALLSRLSEEQLAKVTKFWFVAGIAAAVLGIVQYYVPVYRPMALPDPGLRGRYHATGFAGFHLSYASILAFPLASSLALVAVLYRRERLSRRSLWAIGSVVVFFLASLLTFSKIAWLAAPLTVAFIAIIGFRGPSRYGVIGFLIAFVIIWGSSSTVQKRFEGMNTIRDRLVVWRVNAEMIRAFPWFGVGWQQNSELSVNAAVYESDDLNRERRFASHAHNNVVDQWATTGLFGLAGFIWWCSIMFMMSYRIYVKNHDLHWRVLGLGFLAGWFCFQINGLTQSSFWDAKVMHQTGWITAMTMEAYRRFLKK